MFKWRFVPLLLLATLARAEEPVLLILGDSLSAAYGMDRNQGWVSLLEHRLHEARKAEWPRPVRAGLNR